MHVWFLQVGHAALTKTCAPCASLSVVGTRQRRAGLTPLWLRRWMCEAPSLLPLLLLLAALRSTARAALPPQLRLAHACLSAPAASVCRPPTCLADARWWQVRVCNDRL